MPAVPSCAAGSCPAEGIGKAGPRPAVDAPTGRKRSAGRSFGWFHKEIVGRDLALGRLSNAAHQGVGRGLQAARQPGYGGFGDSDHAGELDVLQAPLGQIAVECVNHPSNLHLMQRCVKCELACPDMEESTGAAMFLACLARRLLCGRISNVRSNALSLPNGGNIDGSARSNWRPASNTSSTPAFRRAPSAVSKTPKAPITNGN